MSTFRLQSNAVHLTYAGHLDHESIQAVLRVNGPVTWWSIVHETSDASNAYDHTHAACGYSKRLSIRNCNAFDVTSADGSRVHANVQPVSTSVHAVRIYEDYHTKAPVHLTQSELGPGQQRRLIDRIQGAKSLLEACEILGIEPKTVGDIKNLRSDKPTPDDCPKPYQSTVWTLPLPSEFRAIFIHGPTGTGKTQWAIHCFQNPLLVRSMDDLRGYNPKIHDGIVFDDMSFLHLPRTAIIHLVDWDLPSSIHCRYTNALIPAHTPKIFTSNLPFHEVFPYDNTNAIDRRFTKKIRVSGPTYQSGLPRAVGTAPEIAETETPARDPVHAHHRPDGGLGHRDDRPHSGIRRGLNGLGIPDVGTDSRLAVDYTPPNLPVDINDIYDDLFADDNSYIGLTEDFDHNMPV